MCYWFIFGDKPCLKSGSHFRLCTYTNEKWEVDTRRGGGGGTARLKEFGGKRSKWGGSAARWGKRVEISAVGIIRSLTLSFSSALARARSGIRRVRAGFQFSPRPARREHPAKEDQEEWKRECRSLGPRASALRRQREIQQIRAPRLHLR